MFLLFIIWVISAAIVMTWGMKEGFSLKVALTPVVNTFLAVCLAYVEITDFLSDIFARTADWRNK